ncbi:MAG TPA: fasciclin domain-containing protein [Armatimonadaceae bacterium]|nr:fasciclin domain-containing protein [Armatimonadaceae bacterium]
MIKKFGFAALAAATVAVIVSPGAARAEDVVGVAAGNPQFSTLVKAVQAAGLVDALKTTGNITVFAPTNEAFAKLPKGTLEMLLKPENKAKLQAILKYHVLPNKVMAKDVVALKTPTKVKTLQGSTVLVNPKALKVDNAKIVKTDVAADNGVIHVIDTVILPK